MRCQRLAGRLQKARSPRGLTFLTWHSRSIGKAPRCSSTNLNLTAFGSRRTGWLFSRISPFAGKTIPQTVSRIRLKSLRMRISRPSRYSPGKLAVLGRGHIRVAMGVPPWVQGRHAGPQIIRNLTSRKPARPCNAHRILAKLIRPACAQGSSPLPHIVLSKERHQAATGPVGLRLVSCVT